MIEVMGSPRQSTIDAERKKRLVQRNLVRFREEAGYTIEVAAVLAKVPIDSLRGYEQGRSSVKADRLKLLADVYGHSSDDFFLESPPPGLPKTQYALVSRDEHGRIAFAALNDGAIPRDWDHLIAAIRDADQNTRAEKTKTKKK